MLSTESANKLKFLKFVSISIDQSSPFIHLVSCLLIELVLEVVILFLKFLRELPNDIVFEFKKLSLLLVMVHKDSPFCQFSW